MKEGNSLLSHTKKFYSLYFKKRLEILNNDCLVFTHQKLRGDALCVLTISIMSYI